MLCHAISPSYGYVKAAHAVVRHPSLASDAKILITYVQGLPEKWAGRPLSEHAGRLGIKGRAYQKAKGQLKEHGFVHEWRHQGDGGLWVTDQLLSTVPLSDDEARRIRGDRAGTPQVGPSDHSPTVGHPGARSVGGQLPVDEEPEKNSPHPPTEQVVQEEAVQAGGSAEPAAADPHVVEAEGVLLSLRRTHPRLRLGARDARGLAETAAEWLRRGVKAAELRFALVSELPVEGVRSAVGFLRYRLVQQMPAHLPVEVPADPAPAAVPPIPCEGKGAVAEHVFRPVGDETVCRACRQEAAWEAHRVKWDPPPLDDGYAAPEPLPWRERVAALQASDPGAG
ncbi:hypothetical protein [Streptomyces sp. NBC_01013]|uniref:hypothetical protein n=1 Tax=Streptomyces sp. NBC_01013 TaxID=2903718 RepID=UPI00386B9919|nr:hypothetical protein OG538_15485 [Streptomyces sp. NBC_01013]